MLITLAVLGVLLVTLAVLLVTNTRSDVRDARAQNRAGGRDVYTDYRSKDGWDG